MASDANIKVHHLTRVEGHGDITAEIKYGELANISFAVVEAPRFFEAFMRGQAYEEVTHMASRICGICAVSHNGAALKATEAAFGTEISSQTEMLRRLAFHGEVISSHVLHIYFLALPDFLGVPSILSLLDKNHDIVLRAMRMKKLAYELCAAVVGRHTHPVGTCVGGFSFVHSAKDLASMRVRLTAGIDDIRATVELFKTIEVPQFERETEYVSLRHPEHYAIYDGDLHSSEGETIDPVNYAEAIREYVVLYSTAKYARWHRPQYMVGALARINNNYDHLSPLARQAARELGLIVPCFNPFMITVAQIVECAHCLEESIEFVDTILEHGIRAERERAEVRPRAGRGVGAVEAPRGTLFHEYGYDGNGKCLRINQVIPTAQNLANLEADMRAYVPVIVGAGTEFIARQLEMLARAYDPCISCSTHLVKVKTA